MFDVPIVAETRNIRESLAAAFDYDLGRIIADMRSRQGKDGRRVVDRTSQEKPELNDALPAKPLPTRSLPSG